MTQILSLISLARTLVDDGFFRGFVNYATGMAWVLSCVMAGFYLLYFGLMLMVWQRPPFVTIRAFLLAAFAASVPPANVMNEGFQDF